MNSRLKNELRKTYKLRRSKLPLSKQQLFSKQICDKIQSLELYNFAKNIAMYHATQGEVDLSSLWQKEKTNKNFYLPKINPNKTLNFLPVNSTTRFRTSIYGILEPEFDAETSIDINLLDIIFLPVLAFDTLGTRLGMGGGYYDRTLALKPKALLIGIAYELQFAPLLPKDDWDLSLDAVITEMKVY